MQRKRTERKIIRIEPWFTEVLVCKDKSTKPYLEIFISEPENIAQSGLGTFFGIFEITDNHPESSYIVNYLISIVKKEYFSNAKRGAIESFEAALHKANLALAQLAEHESISWIGHLNSVCGVIEKNNLHLTGTGTSSAFLLRTDMLTTLTEPEGESLIPNPLKTFQDVLSGRLEYQDKLILATDTIFDIFSLSEIKKSALKFSSEDFIQFLRTALGNELERAAVLVIDLQEKEYKAPPVQTKKTVSPKNVFSQQAFEKQPASTPVEATAVIKEEPIIAEIKEEIQKDNDGFVDKKTGHIYIKEDLFTTPTNHSSDSSFLENYKNKVTSWKESAPRKLRSLKNNIQPGLTTLWKKTKEALPQKENLAKSISLPKKIPQNKLSVPTINWQEKLAVLKMKSLGGIRQIAIFCQKIFLFLKNLIHYRIIPFGKETIARLTEKYNSRKKVDVHVVSDQPISPAPLSSSPSQTASSWLEKINLPKTNLPAFKSFLPDTTRLVNIFKALDYKKRAYLIGIVLAILIIPYFIAKALNQEEKKAEPLVEKTVTPTFALEKDKNIRKIPTLAAVYSGNNIAQVINVNNEIFVATANKLIDTKTKKDFNLPSDISSVETAWEMDDLNLIFLLSKDEKIVSFSPTSSKFQDNAITIPDGANIISAKSYLTYAYLLDSKNNQIYRYPRAEGGFGEKSNWLKIEMDLVNAKDMVISEDVFIINGKDIQKLSRGKKQDFKMESTATPIIPHKIYTQTGSQNIFVLDKDNARIIKLDTNGHILAQYYHAEISSSNDFAVDEDKKEVYIFNNTEVKKFSLE